MRHLDGGVSDIKEYGMRAKRRVDLLVSFGLALDFPEMDLETLLGDTLHKPRWIHHTRESPRWEYRKDVGHDTDFGRLGVLELIRERKDVEL